MEQPTQITDLAAAAVPAHDDEEDPAPLSYEAARAELSQVVEALEAGGVPLEEALDLWERGERLVATCQTWLDNAAKRIEAVRASAAAAKGE